MKKLIVFMFVLQCLLGGCHRKEPDMKKQSGADDAFNNISQEFLSGYLAWRPEYSVNLGFHEYDGKISDFSKESLDKELVRLKHYAQKLKEVDTASLSAGMYYDFRILRCGINSEIFNIEDLKSYTRNPMTYAGAINVNIYIKRNFAPLGERLQSIIAIEKQAPEYFAAARSNLEDSLPKPFIETAIKIAKGSAEFLQDDLIIGLKEMKNDSLMALFKTVNKNAVSELKSFARYLEKEKLPKANNHYSLGRDKYRKMLLYEEGISITPEKLLDIGMAELEREKNIFNASAKIIDPNKKPTEVYLDLHKEHPTPLSLLGDVKKNVDYIQQFLIDKKIVTVPSQTSVHVEETPKFARSTSTASMDSPGPFEKKATEAYYYITPVDPLWTGRQKEDWLGMFDRYTTDLVTIHEVYPGHYVQFLHLNASPATKIEKIFGSYAFIEGWAHYSEKMMVDEGYGNSGDAIKAAKYRLAQSGESLLRLCRLCVSIKMHCEGLSVEDATKFFMDNWHEGEEPSYQEALRGTFDPGYLYYSLGKLQILKLLSDYKNQEGNNFSLQKFHDLILDHGMPQIRFLREMLLNNPKTWNDIL